MTNPAAPALLPCEEVAEQLRRAVRGEIAVTLQDPAWTWREVYAGDCVFRFGEWTITFFNDCDELDYCANAVAPDGRSGNFESWNAMRDWSNPLDELTREEQAKLERLLEQAT